MKTLNELEYERSRQSKGEFVYYVFKMTNGLATCIGFTDKDDALEFIKRSSCVCEMKTYLVVDTEVFNNVEQLSLFNGSMD